MVFIAYDYEGTILSIVRAKNNDLAQAYWQGANIIAHSSSCLENDERFIPLDEHPTGVYPILKTRTKRLSENGGMSHNVIVVSK